jgi:predicted RNase H-like nuclease (RuvC/YqgF family)
MSEKMVSLLLDALLQFLPLMVMGYGIYLLRQKNDAIQDKLDLQTDELGVQAIREKLAKYDIVEKSLDALKVDYESQKRRFDDELINRLAMSRTVEDQSRKITQLTVDMEKANSEIDKLKSENHTLRDDNLSKAMTISILQNERDIALARYESLDKALAKITVNVSSIEVKNAN